jgi:hypothetical protein
MAAPPGNSNAVKGKMFFDALHRALKTYEDKKRKIKRGEALDRIARQLVAETLAGSGWAMQELINRLDGRAHQSIEITGEVTHVSQLTDTQILERLERIRPTAGTAEPQSSETDPSGVH